MNYCALHTTVNILALCTMWMLFHWYYTSNQVNVQREVQYVFMKSPLPSPQVCKSTEDDCPKFLRIGHLYAHTSNVFKPLLAKQIRRDLWQYYVLQGNQDTGFFPVAVLSQNRNCMDHNGCRQLSENDTVSIENENGSEYNVILYNRLLR
jgi:hypothetical protein